MDVIELVPQTESCEEIFTPIVTGVNHAVNPLGFLESELKGGQDPVEKADLLRNIGNIMYFELVELCLNGSNNWDLMEKAKQVVRIMYRLGKNYNICTEYANQHRHDSLTKALFFKAKADMESVLKARKSLKS